MTLHDAIDLAQQRLDAAATSAATSAAKTACEHGYKVPVPEWVAHWRCLLRARESALENLRGLPRNEYSKEESANYGHERFLAALTYVSANWALCDSITSWVGRALCIGKKADPERDSLKLHCLASFIPDRLAAWIRNEFGYAIFLSYKIRNTFIHGGGVDFFEGPVQQSGLTIGKDQWNRLHQESQQEKGISANRRAAFTLSQTERDLGVVLRCCETETDEALGTLLVSTCALIDGHLGFAAEPATT
jgi:hypothetical protein